MIPRWQTRTTLYKSTAQWTLSPTTGCEIEFLDSCDRCEIWFRVSYIIVWMSKLWIMQRDYQAARFSFFENPQFFFRKKHEMEVGVGSQEFVWFIWVCDTEVVSVRRDASVRVLFERIALKRWRKDCHFKTHAMPPVEKRFPKTTVLSSNRRPVLERPQCLLPRSLFFLRRSHYSLPRRNSSINSYTNDYQ